MLRNSEISIEYVLLHHCCVDRRSADIERELMQFKAKYVHLLGLAFKINPPSELLYSLSTLLCLLCIIGPAGLAIDEHDPDEEKV